MLPSSTALRFVAAAASLVALASPAHAADELAWIATCMTTCSERCHLLAEQAGRALVVLQDTCGIPSDGACPSMTPTYDVCASVMDGSANETACASSARMGCLTPEPIYACEVAFDGDVNELACIDCAGRGRLTKAAIDTCEAGFDGDTNELRCLEHAATARLSASDIQHCLDSSDGDEGELTCLEAF